ncbi:Uma2 family endonuclease [Pannus brasiliensis CCIBt3594]|uniref:Uma2 family endonuclease n=1 Tax=Pannus brasiliensis CCIBt3594 TaxID=1427578 RepID=A0AAW9QU44_9CHRO
MVETSIDARSLYPDSDGKPIADNTVQYRWSVRLVSNLKHLFEGQTVFVAGDLLWYPRRVDAPPVPAQAPDVMVVLGRPDGGSEALLQADRGSYKQWEEDDIAPRVVFEILSPGNSAREMLNKQLFYREYGVLEMFFYDPDSRDFWGWARSDREGEFLPITPLNLPWTSPLLGIRFEMSADGLEVYYPDGKPFQDPSAVFTERDRAEQERDRAFAKLRELGIDPTTL